MDRLEISAGTPTDEEVAAVTAALAAIASAAPAPPPPAIPRWGRAGRFEAIGQAPLDSAADPRLRPGPPGRPIRP